jgi:cytochrome P450
MNAIMRVLGATEVDIVQIQTWGDQIVDAAADPEASDTAFIEFRNYLLDTVVRARQAEPTGDLISHLLTCAVDGALLSDERVADIVFLLCLAGFETTVKALSGTIVYLAQHPDVADVLRRQEVDMSWAVEEFLRLFAGAAPPRTATRDCTVGGREIRTGQRLHVLCPSGSRDDSVFEDADRVRFDRATNRHLAFGLGIHRCLGMELARLEMRVGLEVLLKEFPSLQPATDKGPEFMMAVVWGNTSAPAIVHRHIDNTSARAKPGSTSHGRQPGQATILDQATRM